MAAKQTSAMKGSISRGLPFSDCVLLSSSPCFMPLTLTQTAFVKLICDSHSQKSALVGNNVYRKRLGVKGGNG